MKNVKQMKVTFVVATVAGAAVALAAGWCKECFAQIHCDDSPYQQVGYEWCGSYDYDSPQGCFEYNHEKWKQTSGSPQAGDCVVDDHHWYPGYTCYGELNCF